MASMQALSAAAQDRKTRLAQLKSLKRKQPDSREDDNGEEPGTTTNAVEPAPKSPRLDAIDPDANTTGERESTSKYLSGRNYDVSTREARLGFEHTPGQGQDTLEQQALALAEETKRQAEAEAKADRPLDLFQLQPKKPNWDLKRDLERKLEVLNVRTDNAVARLVRERIAGQQRAAKARLAGGVNGTQTENGDGGGDVEAAGIEGATLVEATNLREREDEEEARQEREKEAALLDGS